MDRSTMVHSKLRELARIQRVGSKRLPCKAPLCKPDVGSKRFWFRKQYGKWCKEPCKSWSRTPNVWCSKELVWCSFRKPSCKRYSKLLSCMARIPIFERSSLRFSCMARIPNEYVCMERFRKLSRIDIVCSKLLWFRKLEPKRVGSRCGQATGSKLGCSNLGSRCGNRCMDRMTMNLECEPVGCRCDLG